MDKLDIANMLYLVFNGLAFKDIILTIISIASGLVILGFNIWRWVKAAKADGKITPEEIEEGKNQIVEDLTNLKDKIDK